MKLAVLLAVLTFVPLVRADSIDYSGSGSIANHTARIFGQLAVDHIWGVTDQLREITDLTTGKILAEGNLGMDTLMTGLLSKCGNDLCFSSGSIDIDGRHGNSIFDGKLTHGVIDVENGFVFLHAEIGTQGGTVFLKTPRGFVSSETIAPSRAPIVAEPATYLLWGTGFSLIAAIYRWRSKRA